MESTAITTTFVAESLKASSCEYLLEPHSAVASQTTSNCSNSSHEATASSDSSKSNEMKSTIRTQILDATSLPKARTAKTPMKPPSTMAAATTMLMMERVSMVENPMHSSITTTISSVNDTINKDNSNACGTNMSHTLVSPAKVIPPPPPPRRMLLTEINSKTTATNVAKIGQNVQTKEPSKHHQRKSGDIADSGLSVDAIGAVSSIATDPPAATVTRTKSATPKDLKQNQTAVYNIEHYTTTIGTIKRPSSTTIIETSLLGSAVAAAKAPVTSSPTVSTTIGTPKTVNSASKETGLPDRSVIMRKIVTHSDVARTQQHAGSGLSPRMEMRLALNHDILGDEDLICYEPGPDLTTILGHDLSTFQRLTGRDLLNRSATNRVQPKEAVISFSQQRNSKMDTPTVNRRPRPVTVSAGTGSSSNSRNRNQQLDGVGSARVGDFQPHLQPNRSTWSNFAFAAPTVAANANVAANSKSYNYNSDANKLSDLEILARREKIYCMSQSKSGSQVKTTTTMTTSLKTMTSTQQTIHSDSLQKSATTSATQQQVMMTKNTTSMAGAMATETFNSAGGGGYIRQGESALMEADRKNRLINFIKRRNSEISSSPNCSDRSLNDSNASSTPLHRRHAQLSPSRKDNDKPSLNRRLWKQITKRRRANSVSEIVAV